jgi:FlaA1/EpsC-like NDP-sugar epimerase
MILRILNKYVPTRRMAFFFSESLFILAMVILGAYVRFMGVPTEIEAYELIFYKALLIVGVVQLCLYYFDLYDLKYFRSRLELAIRLLQSLGASSILLATLYYLFPDLIIGRGIFFISLVFMALIIVAWRMLYNYVLKFKGVDQKILIVGTGPLAKSIAREMIEQADTGFRIVGFISETPGRTGEKLVNPSIVGDQSQILDIVHREKIHWIIVALEERRGKFPQNELLSCKMQGVHIQEGIDFYEHLTGRLQVESLRPSFLIFSDGFHKSKVALWLKGGIEFILSLISLVWFCPGPSPHFAADQDRFQGPYPL